MSGGVPAWTEALKRSSLALPDGSSSNVRLNPFSFEMAVNRSFMSAVTWARKSSGCQTTTVWPASALDSAGLASVLAAAVGCAAGAADLLSAGLDSVLAAGLAASVGFGAGELCWPPPQAATIVIAAPLPSTPRNRRREKVRSDAIVPSTHRW